MIHALILSVKSPRKSIALGMRLCERVVLSVQGTTETLSTNLESHGPVFVVITKSSSVVVLGVPPNLATRSDTLFDASSKDIT